MKRELSWRGVLWAVGLPALWIALYYAYVAHVWLALGRWPAFGEQFGGWPLSVHDTAVRGFFGGLIYSLYVVPVIFAGSLVFRRYRHFAVYALCYGAAVGLAAAALFLAPRPFLNWLFD